MLYFSSGYQLRLLILQADLQHADVAGGVPGPTEDLGHGQQEDSWLLSGTLCVTLSTSALFSAWNVDRGLPISPRIAIVGSSLSVEQSGGALQPGHSGKLGHRSS